MTTLKQLIHVLFAYVWSCYVMLVVALHSHAPLKRLLCNSWRRPAEETPGSTLWGFFSEKRLHLRYWSTSNFSLQIVKQAGNENKENEQLGVPDCRDEPTNSHQKKWKGKKKKWRNESSTLRRLTISLISFRHKGYGDGWNPCLP